jgi:cobalt-zinc-cadmium efflux system outer membrane protein
MKHMNLIAVITAVCVISGCSQNRWQVHDTSPTDHYQPPVSLADSASVSTEDQTPYISLVSATDDQADENATSTTEATTALSVAVQSPVETDLEAGMSLSDFESLAFSNNPSIRELAATTQKAAGFRNQVGLKANPIFGYQAMQLADRNTDQHVAFIEQEFVTGSKLELNRRVLNEAVRAQLLELEAQKLRVATDIRVKFYEALAAQRRIHLIGEFQSVTTKAIEVAESRIKAGEGTRIDTLQATVQKNEIDLALQQAEIQFNAAWRGLVALTGTSHMEATTLVGELPQQMEPKEWNYLSSTIVSSSPEYCAAQTRVAQARAALQRHGVQATPNITVQFGAGVDNATNNGMMNLQLGAPIPIFNKNQGNICAAQAEFCRASNAAQRIQKSIEARLADVSRDYDSSLAAVIKYGQEILPNAAESLKLAEQAYEAGETSFVQVLVARRTYFDSNLQFVQAQSQLAQASSKVDGYVLTGGLDAVIDNSGDDSLRGLTFSQQ